MAGLGNQDSPDEHCFQIVGGVDRILDMLRTTVNVGSDIVSATVVDAQVRKGVRLGDEHVSVSGD